MVNKRTVDNRNVLYNRKHIFKLWILAAKWRKHIQYVLLWQYAKYDSSWALIAYHYLSPFFPLLSTPSMSSMSSAHTGPLCLIFVISSVSLSFKDRYHGQMWLWPICFRTKQRCPLFISPVGLSSPRPKRRNFRNYISTWESFDNNFLCVAWWHTAHCINTVVLHNCGTN